MANVACTIASLTKHAATGSIVSLTTITTAAGVKIGVSNKRTDKLVILAKRDATTEACTLVVKASTARNLYSDGTLGDLSVVLSSGAAQTLQLVSPVESARFKDTEDYINLTCTGSTGILAVAAILIA